MVSIKRKESRRWGEGLGDRIGHRAQGTEQRRRRSFLVKIERSCGYFARGPASFTTLLLKLKLSRSMIICNPSAPSVLLRICHFRRSRITATNATAAAGAAIAAV